MTLERDDDQLSDEAEVETAEIRADIEETRLEMGGTLNELGDRLEPSHLMDQAKENVREATIGRVEETAKGMSDMVMETIKRNPIPAAMAGAGLALLWANRSAGHNGHSAERYGAYYGTASGYGQHLPDGRQQGQGLGDKAREAASTVGDTVGQVGDNVGRTVGDVGQNVGQGIGEVGGQLDRFMRASPLAVAAIAAGAGALIGAILPETPQEREMLADAGRQVGSAVRDTVDQATTKAEEAMDRAEEKVSAGS